MRRAGCVNHVIMQPLSSNARKGDVGMFKLNMDSAIKLNLKSLHKHTCKSKPMKTGVLKIYLIPCVIRAGRVNASVDNLMKSQ